MAKFVRISGTGITEQPGLVTSTGVADANKIVETGADGKLSTTLMPPGIGPDVLSVQASENISAGDLVNIHDVAGAARVRRADASNSREAHGFVLSSVTSGNAVDVYFDGPITGLSGLTPGAKAFLSGSTPGGITTTPPTTVGHIFQQVGVVGNGTTVSFSPQYAITLA